MPKILSNNRFITSPPRVFFVLRIRTEKKAAAAAPLISHFASYRFTANLQQTASSIPYVGASPDREANSERTLRTDLAAKRVASLLPTNPRPDGLKSRIRIRSGRYP
jgi:hypothetical protein